MFRILVIATAVSLVGCKDRDTHWQDRTRQQIADILAGRRDSLVVPHPKVLAEIASDDAVTIRIKKLDLGGDVGASEYAVLAKFPNLEWVHIYETQGTDLLLDCISSSTSIKTLDIETCDMTDSGLSHIAGLSQLEYLGIESYGDKLSDSGLSQLAALTNLKDLKIDLGPSPRNTTALNDKLPQCDVSVTISN